MIKRLAIIIAACAALAGCVTAPLGQRVVTSETFLVPSAPGVNVHVRNKHLVGSGRFTQDRVVLFVHGATYPSSSGFDLDLPGGSWMDNLAKQGFDAYFVEIRGYGGSTRPASMSQPAAANPPFADTREAIEDLGAAVDYIRKRRGVDKVDLVGWSWGTAIVGGYTAANNDKVNKMVLYAPLWTLKSAPPISGSGNYRTVTRESARTRGLRGIPQGREEEISPGAWFDQWWKATVATDPVGASQNPPVVRAPNGVIKDVVEYWGKGTPTWDPAKIKVPSLLIVAEWDQDTPTWMAQDIFAKMTNANDRRLEILSEGTHSILIEKNRMRLIQQVQNFLVSN